MAQAVSGNSSTSPTSIQSSEKAPEDEENDEFDDVSLTVDMSSQLSSYSSYDR